MTDTTEPIHQSIALLWLFDRWDDPMVWASRPADGAPLRLAFEDFFEPGLAPGTGFFVWEGQRYVLKHLTDEELDELGASREFDEWYVGEFRPAFASDLIAAGLLSPDQPPAGVA